MNPAPSTVTRAELQAAIRNVPDFPQPGIQFKDITPVLASPRLYAGCLDLLLGSHRPGTIDAVAGIDARGFIFAAAVADRLRAGFIPVRKRGKLPYETVEQSYALEYGTNTLAVHADALASGTRVLLVDDLLATGGTAAAAAQLIERLGGQIVEAVFFIELDFLHGRDRLSRWSVRSLITF
jgi:adenine phosphoribosyltransferase